MYWMADVVGWHPHRGSMMEMKVKSLDLSLVGDYLSNINIENSNATYESAGSRFGRI